MADRLYSLNLIKDVYKIGRPGPTPTSLRALGPWGLEAWEPEDLGLQSSACEEILRPKPNECLYTFILCIINQEGDQAYGSVF